MPNSVSNLGSSSYRGRKTGPKPSFSIDDAIKSALEVGLEQFTLAEVSKKLGVSAPSLYRVVPSRDALVDRCMEYISRQYRPLNPDLSWEDTIRDYVDGTWELLEEFPGTDNIVFNHPGTLNHFQGHIASFAKLLHDKGAPADDSQIGFLVDFLTATCTSTHLGLSTLRATQSLGLGSLDNVDHEVLRDARAHAAARANGNDEDSLNARKYLSKKVDFIINGVAAGFLSAQ